MVSLFCFWSSQYFLDFAQSIAKVTCPMLQRQYLSN